MRQSRGNIVRLSWVVQPSVRPSIRPFVRATLQTTEAILISLKKVAAVAAA